jgi:hypothetical protein
VKFYDRVRETTVTTGTGDITLAGAISQFVAFSSVFSTGDLVPYAIVGQGSTEWETGLGILSGASTLQRTTIYFSSNSNAAVSFSAGTKDVFVTIPSVFMSRSEPMGHVIAKVSGYDMP